MDGLQRGYPADRDPIETSALRTVGLSVFDGSAAALAQWLQTDNKR